MASAAWSVGSRNSARKRCRAAGGCGSASTAGAFGWSWWPAGSTSSCRRAVASRRCGSFRACRVSDGRPGLGGRSGGGGWADRLAYSPRSASPTASSSALRPEQLLQRLTVLVPTPGKIKSGARSEATSSRPLSMPASDLPSLASRAVKTPSPVPLGRAPPVTASSSASVSSLTERLPVFTMDIPPLEYISHRSVKYV